MDEVKDKAKGLMKKLKNPFSSSSRFKGEGHKLGESQQPAASRSSKHQQQQQEEWRKSQQEKWNAEKQQTSAKSQPGGRKASPPAAPEPAGQPDPIISRAARDDGRGSGLFSKSSTTQASSLPLEDKEDMLIAVATFLSGGASAGAVQVIIRLLTNICREPASDKFRKVRMANPKIQESIGSTIGGAEFLEFLGFKAMEDQGEVWRVMDEPSPARVALIKETVAALEAHISGPLDTVGSTETSSFDRQVKVFYVSPEKTASPAELSAEFYELSLDEVKKLAATKRKKLEDSQLLVPKSLREKQALAGRQKHKVSVVRVLFPDNVVLQGFFRPKEPVTALYEFVRASLKNQVRFKLIDPAASARVIAPDSDSSLDQANLVPSAMLRFQSDAADFSGLRSDYLASMEPLTPSPF